MKSLFSEVNVHCPLLSPMNSLYPLHNFPIVREIPYLVSDLWVQTYGLSLVLVYVLVETDMSVVKKKDRYTEKNPDSHFLNCPVQT